MDLMFIPGEWVWFVGVVSHTCSYFYMCSATHVQNEDGSLILLRNNERQRRALAKSLLSNEKLNSDKVPKKVSCSTCKHVHVHFRSLLTCAACIIGFAYYMIHVHVCVTVFI